MNQTEHERRRSIMQIWICSKRFSTLSYRKSSSFHGFVEPKIDIHVVRVIVHSFAEYLDRLRGRAAAAQQRVADIPLQGWNIGLDAPGLLPLCHSRVVHACREVKRSQEEMCGCVLWIDGKRLF